MNAQLLKYHIAKKGFKIRDVSKLMGLSCATFSYKLNGRTQFYIDEAIQLYNLLDLTPADANEIFFKKNVENNQQRGDR